jgi:colanic acid biosynthesis glycosyl transferase WcaI
LQIVCVSPFYAPDLGPSAAMLELLCEDMVQQGHAVTMVAAVPHYPTGIVPPAYRERWLTREERGGVTVLRVWVPSGERANLWRRAWSFVVFQLLAAIQCARVPCDSALVVNPAIETWLPFVVLRGLRRRPCVFGVWDLYPDVGIRAGIFSRPWLAKTVGALERSCLEGATHVQALSAPLADALHERMSTPAKVRVVPLWIDVDAHAPAAKHNAFSTANDLAERFVVLHAGNMGHAHGLEHVVDAARLMELEGESPLFCFVGDGPRRLAIEGRVRQYGLSNVRLFPFQPREQLAAVIGTADIGLVSVAAGVGDAVMPSKVLALMAAGKPVIAVTDASSALARLIADSGAGLIVTPGAPDALAAAVAHLRADPALRARCGAAGRAFVRRRHHRTAAAGAFLELLSASTERAAA